MKITIDFTNKTLVFEDKVNISELFDLTEKIPTIKEFKIIPKIQFVSMASKEIDKKPLDIFRENPFNPITHPYNPNPLSPPHNPYYTLKLPFEITCIQGSIEDLNSLKTLFGVQMDSTIY